MFNRITKDLVIACAVMGLALAQAPKEKKVKDQQEYDLYKSATTTTDAAKRQECLRSFLVARNN